MEMEESVVGRKDDGDTGPKNSGLKENNIFFKISFELSIQEET